MSCLNGARERRIAVNGVGLAYLEWPGTGPTVVCLPGTGLVATMWKDFGTALAPRYRVLALDPRGHGASDCPPEGYALQQFADDLAAFIKEAVGGRAILAGHSYGGGVAFHCAATRPELVDRLIGVDPAIFKRREDVDNLIGTREELVARAAQRPARWESLEELVASLGRRRLYKYWRPDHLRCYAERGSRRDAEGKVVLTFSSRIEIQVYYGNTLDVWSELPAIRCPTLLLRGAHTLAMPIDRAREIAGLIPDCTVVTLERTGHFPPTENPEAFAAAVLDWLAATQ